MVITLSGAAVKRKTRKRYATEKAVLHSIQIFEKENKRVVIDYRSDEGYAYPPAEPGLVRVNHVEGQWTITPLGAHRTLVTSRVYADMGTLLPGWTLNRFFGKPHS